eukprot:1278620-Lingulodinium_polyedra.AAC.1
MPIDIQALQSFPFAPRALSRSAVVVNEQPGSVDIFRRWSEKPRLGRPRRGAARSKAQPS